MEVASLPIHCAYCHGEVTVQVTEWDTDGPTVYASWVCPYCGVVNTGSFPGVVAWVTRGHAERTEPI